MSHYQIEGTSNRHIEQSSGAYLDKNFWSNFHNEYENFKNKLIEHRNKKIPFSLLRVSHSEFSAFTTFTNQNEFYNNFLGRHSNSNEIPIETFIKFCESINSSDYISTQIGYDFHYNTNNLMNHVRTYNKFKKNNELDKLKNKNNFNTEKNNLNIKQLVQLPMDIIYALCANRWFFKTFKNKIGLIGAKEKLDVIKDLMKFNEYREYLGCEYFTDYINIPQRQALDNHDLEKIIEDGVKKSTCDIFLIGGGVSKLKFYHLLKNIRNCIYIDIGHGIDLIAGWGDIDRPYCGEWKNYRIKNNTKDDYVDPMGNKRGEIKYLKFNDQ